MIVKVLFFLRGFSIKVFVIFSDGLHTTAMVKINVRDVNDNRPIFYPASYSFNLAPSSQQGTEVAVVKATDSDSGTFGTVTYSISGGNSQGYFGIRETSGNNWTPMTTTSSNNLKIGPCLTLN